MKVQKIKKRWEERMRRAQEECGRREVFIDKGGESLEISEEVVTPKVVPPEVVHEREEEEEVMFLGFVDGAGKSVIGKAREYALEAKGKEQRKEEGQKRALEARKAAPEGVDKVEKGRSPIELRLREAKTYAEYKALKRALKGSEGP